MKKIDINCDVGEGLNNEIFIMPYIQSCNIACGGHSGDANSMKEVVQLALKYHVKIGAHPSYPDKANFGRKSIQMSLNKFIDSIRNQIESLVEIVKKQGGHLNHIKPHGALYNDMASSVKISKMFLEAILPYKKEIVLFVPYNSAIEKEAILQGFTILYEAFADRRYDDNLKLLSRDEKGAIITNSNLVYQQVSEMFYFNRITSISNKKLMIEAATYCVHSDTKNAREIVKVLHKKLYQTSSF